MDSDMIERLSMHSTYCSSESVFLLVDFLVWTHQLPGGPVPWSFLFSITDSPMFYSK